MNVTACAGDRDRLRHHGSAGPMGVDVVVTIGQVLPCLSVCGGGAASV